MQTAELTRNEIRQRAEKLAVTMEIDYCFSNDEFDELTYNLLMDENNIFEETYAYEYKKSIVAALSVLSNPLISNLLCDETRKDIGPAFNRLFKYFDTIESLQKPILKRMNHMKLKYWTGDLTEQQIDKLERLYYMDTE